MNEVDPQRQTASPASAILTWMAIIFVSPIAMLAAYLLIPNALELVDRVLHHPSAPRGPLTVMLFIQVSIIILLTMTLLSYFKDRVGLKIRYLRIRTITLSVLTLSLGLFAYLWMAMILGGFPD